MAAVLDTQYNAGQCTSKSNLLLTVTVEILAPPCFHNWMTWLSLPIQLTRGNILSTNCSIIITEKIPQRHGAEVSNLFSQVRCLHPKKRRKNAWKLIRVLPEHQCTNKKKKNIEHNQGRAWNLCYLSVVASSVITCYSLPFHLKNDNLFQNNCLSSEMHGGIYNPMKQKKKSIQYHLQESPVFMKFISVQVSVF